ncbi:MAG: caspase family protein [bacterium]|nr:caspase family protein [bacterium]
MCTQVSRKNKQQKSVISIPFWTGAGALSDAHKTMMSLLILLTILLYAGPVVAAQNGLYAIEKESPELTNAETFRVAQLSTSLENWHNDAFATLDLQKRLDRLTRKKNQDNRRGPKKPTVTNKRKTTARSKVRKAVVKRKTKAKTKIEVKIKASTKKKIVVADTDEKHEIVREAAILQRCLQAAGYFNEAITGRIEKSSLQAFMTFRDDNDLLHRSNNLYDPVIQKALFEQCPKVAPSDLNGADISTMAGKTTAGAALKKTSTPAKPINTKVHQDRLAHDFDRSQGPLTTASIGATRKQARMSIVAKNLPAIRKAPTAKSKPVSGEELGERTFANDVLAATSSKPISSSVEKPVQKLARLDKQDATGVTSSFAAKSVTADKAISAPSGFSSRVPSANGQSPAPFSKRLSIADLAMAKPASANTCSPQKHGPAIAMSKLPTLSTSSRQAYPVRNASAYDPYMNDDSPLITGSVLSSSSKSSVSSSYGNPIARGFKKRVRLVQMNIPDKACLPQDLYNMLATAHGRKTDVSICKRDCLPAPRSFSQGQKELFTEQYGINWCGTRCLGIADPLPLSELLKIEREARVHVCMKPQLSLASVSKKGLDSAGINTSIRNLYKHLPGGYGNADNIAVLIGNKNYNGNLGAHDAGHINLAAMKALLIDQLGYSSDNVLILKDAKLGDMQRLFGRPRDVNGELKRRLKSNPDAQLMIYFSGYARSTGLGLNNHLLPVDAVSGREDETAYSLSILYDNLRELDARTTQLFLEASFNTDRSGVVQAPNIAERRVNVAPIVPVRGLAVFTAATGDQKPLIDSDTGIGLFTRYLISGLAGGADQRPIGNGDRIIDSVELYVHLAGNVRLAARKTLGLRQNPTFSRSDNLFLSQLSRKSAK